MPELWQRNRLNTSCSICLKKGGKHYIFETVPHYRFLHLSKSYLQVRDFLGERFTRWTYTYGVISLTYYQMDIFWAVRNEQ